MTRTTYKKIPFDIELAKKITNKKVKGRVVTRDGHKARIICSDKEGYYPIVALVKKSCGVENVYSYNKEGREFDNGMSLSDLFLEVPTYCKDYSNFVPCKWQPCLVRNGLEEQWNVRVCAGVNKYNDVTFYRFGGGACTWEHILPLSNETERLIDTSKSYEELIQELDAESTSIIQEPDAESTATNQEPDAELTSIIPDAEFEDDKEFDFHEIKTFADACEKLGMKEHLLTGSIGGDREAQGQAQALYKLLIIQKAMNNGVWRDEGGWSYYPYWVLYSKEEMEHMTEGEKQRKGIRQLLSCAFSNYTEGVRCADANIRGAVASTYCGFPLCFNSEEAALYAAKQFEDLFFQYYGIKVKA